MDKKLLDRIVVDPAIRNGKPCIKGTRILVHEILMYYGEGNTRAEILEAFPALTEEDIDACILYAFKCVTEAYRKAVEEFGKRLNTFSEALEKTLKRSIDRLPES
jgi:uncharacterized protein (DUF433 family)